MFVRPHLWRAGSRIAAITRCSTLRSGTTTLCVFGLTHFPTLGYRLESCGPTFYCTLPTVIHRGIEASRTKQHYLAALLASSENSPPYPNAARLIHVRPHHLCSVTSHCLVSKYRLESCAPTFYSALPTVVHQGIEAFRLGPHSLAAVNGRSIVPNYGVARMQWPLPRHRIH